MIVIMLRSTLETEREQCAKVILHQDMEIQDLKSQVVLKEVEVKALLHTISLQKCNHYTSSDLLNEKKPPQTRQVRGGRSNWRARAQEASNLTIPKPADSIIALEEKVIAEGGKV